MNKIKSQKAFIQIPILIAIVIFVIISGTTAGIVLHEHKQKENKPSLLSANVSEQVSNQKIEDDLDMQEQDAEEEPVKATFDNNSDVKQEKVVINQQTKEPAKQEPKSETKIEHTPQSQSQTNPCDKLNCANSNSWVNIGNSYACCDANQSCICQKQEYRDYACSGNSCEYSITNSRINKSNYSQCNTSESCTSGVCKSNCQNTDTSCGLTSCQNCNNSDGCSGNNYLNYYCSNNSCVKTEDNCSDCSCSCGGYKVEEKLENNNCNDGKDNDCDGKIDAKDSKCVSQITDTTPPILNSVAVNPATIASGKSITATVSAIDDISGIKSISVRIESPSGTHANQSDIWNIDSKGRWYGDILVPLNSEAGVWKVKMISLVDNTGNIKYFYETDIRTTFTVTSPITDITPPALHAVTVSPATVKPGENVNVVVSASDDISGIKSVLVRLESPTGIHVSASNIWNIDPKGNWYGGLTIPPNCELGTWIVKAIGLTDNTENEKYYYYGTDISTTFNVVSNEFMILTSPLGGNITQNSKLTLENSPYAVTETVQVLEGVTLEIEPGVVVGFGTGTSLSIGGELIAIGSETQKITFTSNKDNPNPGDWVGIFFTDKSTDAVVDEDNNYISGSIVANSIIEYSEGLSARNANPFITKNIVRYNSGYPIILIWSNSIVLNNLIDSNVATAINLQISDAKINNNTIVNNYSAAYILGGNAEIYKNTFENNKSGLYFISQSNSRIQYNNIFNNEDYNIRMDQNTDIRADNNYWGTTEVSIIDASINDYYDDIVKGKVNYQPIATSEIPDAGVQ